MDCVWNIQNDLLEEVLCTQMCVIFDSCSLVTFILYVETCRNFLWRNVTQTFMEQLSAFCWLLSTLRGTNNMKFVDAQQAREVYLYRGMREK